MADFGNHSSGPGGGWGILFRSQHPHLEGAPRSPLSLRLSSDAWPSLSVLAHSPTKHAPINVVVHAGPSLLTLGFQSGLLRPCRAASRRPASFSSKCSPLFVESWSCYHVATPPINPYDSLRYIQALENEVGSAALKYGGSELHRHAPTLQPKQQQQQKWNGGRPYVPGGAGPPLRQPEPEQRIASLLCGASKTPADTLQPVDCTWWQRRLEIERPTSSADADRWLRQRYAQRPPRQRISHAGISRSSTASFVAPSNGGTLRARLTSARRHQG